MTSPTRRDLVTGELLPADLTASTAPLSEADLTAAAYHVAERVRLMRAYLAEETHEGRRAFVEGIARELRRVREQEFARHRPPLNLAAARERLVARKTSPSTRKGTPAPASVEPVRRRTFPALNVGAVRAARAAAESARRPPLPPTGARRFVSGGSWRWVHVDSRLPNSGEWASLAADLVDAGPLLSLSISLGEPVEGSAGGHSRFQDGDGGAIWATVVVDPAKCGTRRHTERVIGHELAHVADELAALQISASATSWRRGFSDPHRSDQAEAFAVAAEEWVTSRTRGAELIAAARAHQEGRTRRVR